MLKSEDFKAKQNIVRLIVSCHNETADLKGGRSAVINYPVTKIEMIEINWKQDEIINSKTDKMYK